MASDDHRVRTMFATHYHELTVLEEHLPAVHNLSVSVSEDGSNVVFLHRIIDGPASKSYGIHVAKIAGIPKAIRQSASRKLKELEAQSAPMPATTQISFFDSEIAPEPERVSEEPLPYENVLKEIRGMDINSLTPIQALVRLQEIQNEIKDIDEDSEE